MERKKSTYLNDKKAYDLEHGIPQTAPASAPASAAAPPTSNASATGPDGKEYTGKKRGRKSNAERALMAAAAATDAGSAAAQASNNASSSKQADIPVNAPSKKVSSLSLFFP